MSSKTSVPAWQLKKLNYCEFINPFCVAVVADSLRLTAAIATVVAVAAVVVVAAAVVVAVFAVAVVVVVAQVMDQFISRADEISEFKQMRSHFIFAIPHLE